MTTIALATVRAAIKARFAAIPDIGVVHDYERYTKQASALTEAYCTTIDGEQQLRGLHFRLASARESYIDISRWVVERRWQARYFMALNDAAGSEKTFDDLIEAIQDDFRSNGVIAGAGNEVELVQDEELSGVTLAESVPVLFAGVLCHSARLTFTTRQYE